jgi:hypothetical protein
LFEYRCASTNDSNLTTFLRLLSIQYVTLDDIMNLIGSDSLHSEEVMRQMWGDSMQSVNCNRSRITYDDFLLLMKGQTKEAVDQESKTKVTKSERLVVVLEETCAAEEKAENVITLPSGDQVTLDGSIRIAGSDHGKSSPAPMPLTPKSGPMSTMPLTPIMSGSGSDDREMDDTPLSMDADDGFDPRPLGQVTGPFALSLTPPISPTRGATDYVSPLTDRRQVNAALSMSEPHLTLPGLSIPRPHIMVERARSRSMGNDEDQGDGSEELKSVEEKRQGPPAPKFAVDARRAVLLPERDPKQKEVIINKNKSNLQVNRQLYRAHRQMRLSVVEASKRFEEQQARHVRDVLIAQNEAEGENDGQGLGMIQAGLVMRRGEKKIVSSEDIRSLLDEYKSQQQALFEKANKRGGRGRRTRKKTISDMSGMIGSFSQEDLGPIAVAAAKETKDDEPMSTVQAPKRDSFENVGLPLIIESTQSDIRGATVPGEFRKVQDPFSARGKYGITRS